MTKDTAFHARTSALTRDLAEYRGYWLPTAYSGAGPITEYWACRERAAVIDLSPLRKFEVTGPEAASSLPLKLTIDYDDGLVIYLNGREIARRNLGTAGLPTAYNATATTGRNASASAIGSTATDGNTDAGSRPKPAA
jgi:hypothetical protein